MSYIYKARAFDTSNNLFQISFNHNVLKALYERNLKKFD